MTQNTTETLTEMMSSLFEQNFCNKIGKTTKKMKISCWKNYGG